MIRKARVKDAGQIQALVNSYAKQELMLPLSLLQVYEGLRDFWVYEAGGRIAGCCALRITWQDLAEIRSLAIKKQYRKKGIGHQLISMALEEAEGLGTKAIFVLTYIPEYFKKYGFRRIDKNKLPHKIWAECINCLKFPDCNEVALIKKL